MAPVQSIGLAWPRDSATTRWVMIPATTAMGRLTRKIARQPAAAMSRPPSTGATAAAAPLIAPQTPNATERSRPE